jgi:microcompartment protein CcmK/EutM
MRISKVIGKVTMNRRMDEVPPGSYLIVRTYNRGTLAGRNEGNDETLVMFDPLAAREGDLIGLVEGREAAIPFGRRRVPFDAYNGCIIDTLNFQPVLDGKQDAAPPGGPRQRRR